MQCQVARRGRGQQRMTPGLSPALTAISAAFRHMFHVLLREGGLKHCQMINSQKLITFIVKMEDYVMGLIQF